MSPEAQTRIESMLGEILRRLDSAISPEPPLTQTAFAKRVGKHPKTISNWIKKKKLLTRGGMIPASELRKYLS